MLYEYTRNDNANFVEDAGLTEIAEGIPGSMDGQTTIEILSQTAYILYLAERRRLRMKDHGE